MSLLDVLTDIEGNTDDDAPSLFRNSDYYDHENFTEILKSKSDKFSVVSLNCQSLQAKFDQLKIYVEDLESSSCTLSSICLQETWLKNDSDTSLLQLENYNFISKGSSCSTHGGVAVYLHKKFDYQILDFHSHSGIWDGLFIELNIKQSINQTENTKKLIIGNIYRPPRNLVENYNTFINEITEITYDLQRRKGEIVIVGDFNLDLLKIDTNQHIKEFFESMLANGFLPKITLPTRLTENNGTLIDNIFCKLSKDLSETTAGILRYQISDHKPCFVTLDYLLLSCKSHKYIRVRKGGQNSLRNFCEDIALNCQISNLNNELMTDPNLNYNVISENITLSLEKHFPEKVVKFDKHKHKGNSWITHGIIRSIKQRDKLYAILKRTASSDVSYQEKKENLANYNRILKQNIRSAKKLHYHACFEKFKDDVKKTWSAINGILNRCKNKEEICEYFVIDNELTSDKKRIANGFNKFFVQIGQSISESVQVPPNRSYEEYLSPPVRQKFSFGCITKEIVLKIIDGLKPKTSCGLDGLSNKLLKTLKFELSDCLTLIINQAITTGIFPEKLKIAKVTPIYKKGDAQLFENYRPISILPAISKVIEKVMHMQIQQYFDTFNLFCRSQYGFRPQHSTELAALEVVDQIFTQMDDMKIPLNIYLDLSKAFDSLNHQILLNKLKHYGFEDISMRLMVSYLENRKQIVTFNNSESDLLTISTGVPQGSILGPLLFLIYINDMVNATKCFRPVIYADDTTLGASLHHFGKDNSKVEAKINEELGKISLWLKLNRLSLNVNKTKAMIFHTAQRKIDFTPNILIDGNKIEYVDYFNYLGIHLDKHLTFDKHIDIVGRKISRVSGIVNKLKHFLPQATLVTLYNTLILPHLNYGVLLWGSKADRLEKTQNKVVRNITCSKYNAHVNPLYKKLSFLKATHICALHELKFCYQLQHNSLPYYFRNSVFRQFQTIHTHDTRGSGDYQLPRMKHTFMKSSLRYRIPNTFNSTDDLIKDKMQTLSLAGFKRLIKNYFINSYNT